ncbi:sialin-like [Tetranychus urticae]|uniref:sialin-like n=1 Tax=Tetranychus urticae TaxID=32264 RepID=UPI00077BCD32|nr:sialin-like [Tetranychus urticae]
MDSNIVSDPSKQPFIKIRVIVCVAAFFINLIFCSCKMTIVVSSVSIVHSHTRSESLKNEVTNAGLQDKLNSRKIDTESNFKWTQSTVDRLISIMFCGGLFSPIPAGRLADRLGPKRIVLASCLTAGVSMLLFPSAVRWNVYAVCALGFVIGFFLGPGLSSYSGLVSRWSPKYEKTLFITTISSGAMIAMILTGPFVGYLCSLNYLGGWPLPFYILGSGNIFMGLLWFMIVTDEPENHPLISQSEKEYILKERSTINDKSNSNNPIPWAQMFLSGPIWALIFVHFSHGWFSAIIATQVPEFFKSLLKISMSQDGVFAALPYVGSSISLTMFSYCSDKLREKGIFSTTAIRKICADFGFIFGPLFLVVSTLVGHKTKAVITCIVLAKTLAAAQIAGSYGVHLDLSPTYSGLLGGLIDSMHNFGGMIMNQTAYYLVGDHPDLHHWSNLFLVTTAICIIGTHYFALLGSSKLQPWDPTFESEEKAFDDDQNGQLAATTIYDPEVYILDSASGSMINRKYSRPSLSQ